MKKSSYKNARKLEGKISFPETVDLVAAEQIAVLVRLAFAEMLVEQGHPAAVILDDAFVFSDDRQRNRMFDIFNIAAGIVQWTFFRAENSFSRIRVDGN